MRKYVFVLFFFEALVFSAHYLLMSSQLKGSDSEYTYVSIIFLSAIWGLAASTVPIIVFFFLSAFSGISERVTLHIKRTDGSDQGIVKLVEQLPGLLIGSLVVLTVMFCTEVYYVYKAMIPQSLYPQPFNWGVLLTGIAAAIAHHIITFILMFTIFVAVCSQLFGYIDRRLTLVTQKKSPSEKYYDSNDITSGTDNINVPASHSDSSREQIRQRITSTADNISS